MMTNMDRPDLVLDDRRRLASPNEKRCIARQDIGHQRRLVIGAIYASNVHNETLSLENGKQPFFSVLKYCIEQHPLLSTVILNADTESPEFATPKNLDLNAHLEIRNAPDIPEDMFIEKLLAQLSDEQFLSVHTTPPWKVILVSLRPEGTSRASRLLVLCTNYHSHGDGRSGLAFQDSFHAGLSKCLAQDGRNQPPVDSICSPPSTLLLPPIEEGGRMTLSWSYLLSPLLGTYLPTSITSLLGLRTSWLSSDARFWRGKKARYDPKDHATGLRLITIPPSTLSKVVKICRAKNSTFTGVLQHLVAHSLNAPDGGALHSENFVAGVAVDMRHLFPDVYSRASVMNCVTGHSELVEYDASQKESDWATDSSSPFWEAARKTTASLKVASSTLHDQPIGLLQYLKAFRPWTIAQIGKERDMSFEISNLGPFSPALPGDDDGSQIHIESVVFSQPAKATGSLLDFNPVSVTGGPLNITVTWQRGVLGLPEVEGDEDVFVRNVCSKLQSSIDEIAALPL